MLTFSPWPFRPLNDVAYAKELISQAEKLVTKMWMRKDAEDASKERQKLWLAAFGSSLSGFVIIFVMGVIVSLTGPLMPVSGPLKGFSSFEDAIIHSLKTALIVGILFYFLYILSKGTLPGLSCHSTVMICDKCFRVKNNDGKEACECGGKFEDFSLWKWVDD
jgi:hypothetical protein